MSIVKVVIKGTLTSRAWQRGNGHCDVPVAIDRILYFRSNGETEFVDLRSPKEYTFSVERDAIVNVSPEFLQAKDAVTLEMDTTKPPYLKVIHLVKDEDGRQIRDLSELWHLIEEKCPFK